MTEDNRPRVSSSESTDSSTTKQRKKRKWDQPADSLVSAGIAVPGILPLSNMGFLAGITSPGVPSTSSVTFTNQLASTGAALTTLLQVSPQQHGTAINQKLSQPRIQDEIIAREIVINDADSAVRYKLTKKQTQEEIQKCTSAIVITRGKYRPPDARPDGEKPLYLHISAGAHLETTAERIRAVDSAAAMVEEILKHGSSNDGVKVSYSLNTCVFLGFEPQPYMNIAARIRGPNDQYVNHIMNETGVTVLLKGRGSGNSESIDNDGQQPLHLFLSSNNPKSLERAKLLAENLLDTISAEFGVSRVSSSKVYGAVPPPPQLLAGVQSSGAEVQPKNLPAASLIASAPITVSSMATPAIAGVASTVTSQGIVSHSGWSSAGPSQANTSCSSSLIQGTSYSGYGGIYPQATPLQQVALALRQSASPLTSTVAPATTAGCLTPHASAGSSGSSSEKDKHSSRKRKFQEQPADLKRSSNLNQNFLQGSEPAKPCDLTSDVGGRDISNNPASKKLNEPSNSCMPPPPPRMMPSPPMPPLPPKFNSKPPPPPPKFSSLHNANDSKSSDPESRAENVPDPLIKLMEYGDDDDEPEETSQEPLKRGSNSTDSLKPFWAV